MDSRAEPRLREGFSGAGVWSPEFGAVVALVAQKDARGNGRAVTLHEASRRFPDQSLETLARWTAASADGFSLGAPWARADEHSGYLFYGRQAALRRIGDWLTRPVPDGRVLVVTGAPGSGKSAVLWKVLTAADRDASASGSVGCAVHVKGKSALEVAREIARFSSIRLPEHPKDLSIELRRMLSASSRQRFNLILDAVDEATTPTEARLIIEEIVLPVAQTCADAGVQVLVGTRRTDASGSLLARFGASLEVVDLDDAEFFDRNDLTEYALARLQATVAGRPAGPYADAAIARRVAERIAELSDRNFLIAGLIAQDHAARDESPVDPSAIGFSASVDFALDRYVEAAGAAGDATAEHALTALAFADAPGLPADLWTEFIAGIYGSNVSVSDLARFSRSSSGSELIEAGRDGDRWVYRLFHQALNEALLRTRARESEPQVDQRAITTRLIAVGRARQWREVSPYLLRSLPRHAAAAGPEMVDALLSDIDYLLRADMPRLTAIASMATSHAGQEAARLLELTPDAAFVSAGERAAMLSVTAAMENFPSARDGRVPGMPYCARWAACTPQVERAVLEGHGDWVRDLCEVQARGESLLASGGDDGMVRLWDPRSGQQRAALSGHERVVGAVCQVRVGDEVLLASGGNDWLVRLWDPVTAEPRAVLQGHTNWVRALCQVQAADEVLLASGDYNGTVLLWDPATCTRRAVLSGHGGWVTSLCQVRASGEILLASACADGILRLWDPVTAELRLSVPASDATLWAVCEVQHDDEVLLASGGDDCLIRMWDPLSGQQRSELAGHRSPVAALCEVRARRDVQLASGDNDGSLRLWNLHTGRQRAELEGHTDAVEALCTVRSGHGVLLASASDDQTVRLWSLATRQQARAHSGPATSVCSVRAGGEQLLASGGSDGTARLWDPATGQQRAVLHGHSGPVNAVCGVLAGDEQLLVSGGSDGTVRLWDPVTGQQRAALEGHDRPVLAVCQVRYQDEVLLASGGDDCRVRIWDPVTRKQCAVLAGHSFFSVEAVCQVEIGHGLLLASAGNDGSVMLWDLTTGRRAELGYHASGVWSVCPVRTAGEVLLASAGNEPVVRLLDPLTGLERRALAHKGGVPAVCEVRVGSDVLLASGGRDKVVRLWDPQSGYCLLAVPVHHQVRGLSAADSSALAIATDAGLVIIDLAANVVLSAEDS